MDSYYKKYKKLYLKEYEEYLDNTKDLDNTLIDKRKNNLKDDYAEIEVILKWWGYSSFQDLVEDTIWSLFKINRLMGI